jgi:hypothetical protein
MTVGPATGPQNSAYNPTLLSFPSDPMRLLPLPLLALAACWSGVSTTPPPEPAAVSLAAGSTRYTLTEHRHVEQTVQGQAIVSDAVARFVFSLSLTPTDSGLAAVVVIDSAALEDDAGGREGAARLAGARLTGQLGPTGPRFAPADDAAPHELLDQLALSLHDLLPRLPAGGVHPGTSWHDTTVVTGRAAGVPVTLTARATSQAGAWERLDRGPVLGVSRRATYALDGEGSPTGSWIVLRGRGVQHARVQLDTTGSLLRGVRADTLRVEIEVSGTGLVIPVVQIRADTLQRAIP